MYLYVFGSIGYCQFYIELMKMIHLVIESKLFENRGFYMNRIDLKNF
jgi:hypothetical protein